MGGHHHHPGGSDSVQSGIFHESGRLPEEHRVHGGRRHRDDSGGPLSADHRRPHLKHHTSGQKAGAPARYEEHRDIGKSGRAVRGQDGNHHRARNGSFQPPSQPPKSGRHAGA